MDSRRKEQAAVYEVIGVNGAGGISDVYLENMIRRFPTIRVKAVCSRQLEKARAIRHGEPARVSAEMAFHVLEVFEGLYRSNKEHTWVEIESRFERPAPMPEMDDIPDEAECFL